MIAATMRAATTSVSAGGRSHLDLTPLGAYPGPMAVMTIQLQLDDDLVHGIRELAAARGEPEDAVVTQALASFLGFSALDEAHALGGLPQDEADRLAVEEVRAVRAARDARA